MTTEIAHLITQLLEAWNAHDVEGVTALHAIEYEGMDVAQPTLQHGHHGIRQTVRRYLRAFPDLHFTNEEMVVQGDRVVLVWTAQGTHRGPLMNIPATGRTVELRGVSLLTVRDNKVQQAMYFWDVAGFLRAIGLLPNL
jgi:steroid delta-isomerase-like uncharacterized protein